MLYSSEGREGEQRRREAKRKKVLKQGYPWA
jgi:hypothetical protein